MVSASIPVLERIDINAPDLNILIASAKATTGASPVCVTRLGGWGYSIRFRFVATRHSAGALAVIHCLEISELVGVRMASQSDANMLFDIVITTASGLRAR